MQICCEGRDRKEDTLPANSRPRRKWVFAKVEQALFEFTEGFFVPREKNETILHLKETHYFVPSDKF